MRSSLQHEALRIASEVRKVRRRDLDRWQDAAGFGLIQPDACLAETHKPFLPVDLDKSP
jgi:hypothetical protein